MQYKSAITILFLVAIIGLSEASSLKKNQKSFVTIASVSTLKRNEVVSFQSSNYPNYYLRHRNYELWLDAYESSDLYNNDSSFTVRSALNGQAGFVSFESVNYPGYYIRHSNYLLYINQNDGSDLFKSDSSFKVGYALNGTHEIGYVSLNSYNYPSYYIRHQDYRGKISKSDGSSLFNNDATWRFVPGNSLKA